MSVGGSDIWPGTDATRKEVVMKGLEMAEEDDAVKDSGALKGGNFINSDTMKYSSNRNINLSILSTKPTLTI